MATSGRTHVVRGMFVAIAVGGLACSGAEPASSSADAGALSSAAFTDVGLAPSVVELCVDGSGELRGSFVASNLTDRRFELLFASADAIVDQKRVLFEPHAAAKIEFEPRRAGGAIIFRNESQSGALGRVEFSEKVDVRLLDLRAEGSDVFVMNLSARSIPYGLHVEGPATCVLARAAAIDVTDIAPNATERWVLRRNGSGLVRISLLGDRCSRGEMPERAIEIP